MHENILIIEDNMEIAEYLKDLVKDSGYIAFIANNGTSGLKLISKIKPDLVLLDLVLPDIKGESICQKIKEEFPQTKIIIITAKNSSQDLAKGLDLGADDFVPKPIDATVLMARIKSRLKTTDIDIPVLKCADLTLNQNTFEVKRENKDILLTPQEYKLLLYLMLNKNLVLSRDMILNRIWEGNPDIETRVVDVYIGYLRSKIDFKKPNLLQTIRGFGYKLQEK